MIKINDILKGFRSAFKAENYNRPLVMYDEKPRSNTYLKVSHLSDSFLGKTTAGSVLTLDFVFDYYTNKDLNDREMNEEKDLIKAVFDNRPFYEMDSKTIWFDLIYTTQEPEGEEKFSYLISLTVENVE